MDIERRVHSEKLARKVSFLILYVGSSTVFKGTSLGPARFAAQNMENLEFFQGRVQSAGINTYLIRCMMHWEWYFMDPVGR